jgi:hypothetical protein
MPHNREDPHTLLAYKTSTNFSCSGFGWVWLKSVLLASSLRWGSGLLHITPYSGKHEYSWHARIAEKEEYEETNIMLMFLKPFPQNWNTLTFNCIYWPD